MKKPGHKNRSKRSSPVHGRQSKKRLEQEVKAIYGRESSRVAEDDDHDWQEWEPTPTSTPKASPGTEPPATPEPATAQKAQSSADLELHDGLVVALASGLCWVDLGGQRQQAALPSRFARNQRSHLAVGDDARIARLEDGTWRLEEIQPRRTELSRPDPHNPRQRRLIAANIDDVVIVASVVAPALRLALIDRYLITVDRGGALPLIAINKIDLLPNDAQRDQQLQALAPYRDQGLRIVPCSTQTGQGIEDIRHMLAGRTAVFVGHSGVGKSSLLNALDPAFGLQTGEVGEGGSGRHTTTRSGLYQLPGGIRLIDTPGIRELGLGSLDPRELRLHFPEFTALSDGCRFSNCSHLHEPSCAVRQAVNDGNIDRRRFDTYRRLLASLEEEDLGY